MFVVSDYSWSHLLGLMVVIMLDQYNTAEVARREAEIVLEQLRSVIIVNRSARIISDFRSLFYIFYTQQTNTKSCVV